MQQLAILLLISAFFSACKPEEKTTDAYERVIKFSNLDAVKQECLRYTEQLIGNKEVVIKLGKDASNGEHYYEILLYPGLSQVKLTQLEEKCKLVIPNKYKSFLSQINGAFIYDISLYGLPGESVDHGLANRDELHALNLYTANSTWKYEYALDPSCFLFGSSPYDSTANKHYFIKNSIYSSKENGVILHRWASINEMLEFELSHQH